MSISLINYIYNTTCNSLLPAISSNNILVRIICLPTLLFLYLNLHLRAKYFRSERQYRYKFGKYDHKNILLAFIRHYVMSHESETFEIKETFE